MGLFKKFVSQTRKPEGFLGKMMVNGMNGGHAKMADWGMSHLHSIAPKEIVELGCGGGRNAGELMRRYPAAFVTAIDYSDVSVGKAREYNKAMIDAGRCVVKQGDVSKLDLSEEIYDLATAFETIYFWPGLEKCFRQVARILKAGGIFMICNESDGTDAAGLKYEKIIDGMKVHTAGVIETALRKAGFSDVRTDHHPSKPWITVLAKKYETGEENET
jgi:ubiquinone/menaquinone biosynthesis C-methylase UbiE